MAKPLPALLSQVLVANSVEFSNEFERRMGEVHRSGAKVTLFGWSNLWRFLDADGMSVQDVANRAGSTSEKMLACYERWGFLAFEPAAGAKPIPRKFVRLYGREERDGFGSTRGIRKDWIVRPTEKGARAIEVGPSVSRAIDKRWSSRFGAYEALREALIPIVDELDVEYPHCMLASIHERHDRMAFPPRTTKDVSRLPLSSLLSKALAAFAVEFDGSDRSGPSATLLMSASLLRVLDTKGVPVGELQSRTGLTLDSLDPEERSWKPHGLIALEPDPNAKRGKIVRLTEKGDAARAEYPRRAKAIETAWRKRFDAEAVDALRRSLQEVMADEGALRAGLVAPEFSVRHPNWVPPDGARNDRLRATLLQNEAFVRDPSRALPHFPLWALTHYWGI